ncbi:MAG: glycosyltransferase family 4 protein [Candidatus Polarisedimenticolaceae bacterium]|nr:glycosyltransferase family 4 protein [Candidatus Polarisedimenticolaceae bacterium]
MKASQVMMLVSLSGLMTWGAIYFIRLLSKRVGLIQQPNERSSHSSPTPHGGGLGIVLVSSAYGLWLIIHNENISADAGMIVFLSLVLAIVGLLDDKFHLSASVRLLVQFLLCAGLLLWFTGSSINILLAIVIVIYLIAGIWWINLFNFMDGIDGIASSQAVFMLASALFMIQFYHPDAVFVSDYWGWMLVLLASCLGFLWHNWQPAKIFMGDVGSTYIAFMLFVFAYISMTNGLLSLSFWLIIACLFICDATITLVRRVIRGEAWYQPHRKHLYQQLSRRLNSHSKVTLRFLLVNVTVLFPLAFLSLWVPSMSIGILLVTYTVVATGMIGMGAGTSD